jgi:hypothetical protein
LLDSGVVSLDGSAALSALATPTTPEEFAIWLYGAEAVGKIG